MKKKINHNKNRMVESVKKVPTKARAMKVARKVKTKGTKFKMNSKGVIHKC